MNNGKVSMPFTVQNIHMLINLRENQAIIIFFQRSHTCTILFIDSFCDKMIFWHSHEE